MILGAAAQGDIVSAAGGPIRGDARRRVRLRAIAAEPRSAMLAVNREILDLQRRLGEDIARATEILVTDTIERTLAPAGSFAPEPRTLSISGMTILGYWVLH